MCVKNMAIALRTLRNLCAHKFRQALIGSAIASFVHLPSLTGLNLKVLFDWSYYPTNKLFESTSLHEFVL
jgi:hypothetical protein